MKNSSVFRLYKPIPDNVDELSDEQLEKLTPGELHAYNLAKLVRKTGAEGSFARDEEGNDWYQWLTTLSTDTLKVAYRESDNVIMQFSFEAAAIFPIEQRVAEVAKSNIPEGFIAGGVHSLGKSIYSDGTIKFIPVDEVAVAEQQKSELMVAANNCIAPLQDALDLDIAGEDEHALLLSWKKYRVLLNRIDTSLAPDIDWPVMPSM